MMKAILSILIALSILPFYAFDRSQNPKLFDEVLQERHSDYSQFAQGASGNGGSSGGDEGGGDEGGGDEGGGGGGDEGDEGGGGVVVVGEEIQYFDDQNDFNSSLWQMEMDGIPGITFRTTSLGGDEFSLNICLGSGMWTQQTFGSTTVYSQEIKIADGGSIGQMNININKNGKVDIIAPTLDGWATYGSNINTNKIDNFMLESGISEYIRTGGLSGFSMILQQ